MSDCNGNQKVRMCSLGLPTFEEVRTIRCLWWMGKVLFWGCDERCYKAIGQLQALPPRLQYYKVNNVAYIVKILWTNLNEVGAKCSNRNISSLDIHTLSRQLYSILNHFAKKTHMTSRHFMQIGLPTFRANIWHYRPLSWDDTSRLLLILESGVTIYVTETSKLE